MKPLLLKHLDGENIGRFPVWMMRQAGRFLPKYMEIKEKSTFWDMVTTPKIAKEVSLLPLEYFPVDGIIFFSDILTLPFGMGVPITMKESIGPCIETPLTTSIAFSMFERYRPQEFTYFVGEALQGIKEVLPKEKTLLGFAGAPWTVASYLIEGSSNKNFKTILSWMGRDPKDLSIALEYLARATTEYLLYQAKNGADIVQLFDTWACHMPKSFFEEHYAPILEKIFKKLEEENVRVIYFFKNAHHLIEPISKLSCKILSVDGLITLKEWDNKFQGKFSLQGNLDPTLLFTNEAIVRQKTRALVQEARTLAKPAIINLGHGILPKTPVQNVRAFVEEATTLWI